MGKKTLNNLEYYSKIYLFKSLGTISLIKLMKLAYEEENRVIIGCYFFYNPNKRLDNYLFRELKGSRDEYEKNFMTEGTLHNKLFNFLNEKSKSRDVNLERKKELIIEIKTFIDHYGVNLSYFCEENHLPYQVVYRTVIKNEHHKMSVEKLENLVNLFELEFHK